MKTKSKPTHVRIYSGHAKSADDPHRTLTLKEYEAYRHKTWKATGRTLPEMRG